MNQAISLAEALKREEITHVLCSDLIRAYRTALAIATHHPSLSVTADKLLREQDLGGLEGKSWLRTRISVPKNASGAHASSSKGESKVAMKERAKLAWSWILEQTDLPLPTNDKFVVVVSHGIFLDALFSGICEFYGSRRPPSVFWVNTGYVKFSVNTVRIPCFKVECTNETRHLNGLLRQKGGIGSSKYNPSQKNMKHFIEQSPKRAKQESGKFR
jgi:broad specificity phosphatase PhoE